jgi:hypothetical protein
VNYYSGLELCEEGFDAGGISDITSVVGEGGEGVGCGVA